MKIISKKFYVTAIHEKLKYRAPRMLIQASKIEEALKIGASQTRLADFPNTWKLICNEILTNKQIQNEQTN